MGQVGTQFDGFTHQTIGDSLYNCVDMNDELAAAGVHEFAFVVQPLKLEGATGSTVAPVAIH